MILAATTYVLDNNLKGYNHNPVVSRAAAAGNPIFLLSVSSCSGVLEKEAQTQSGLGKTEFQLWRKKLEFQKKRHS